MMENNPLNTGAFPYVLDALPVCFSPANNHLQLSSNTLRGFGECLESCTGSCHCFAIAFSPDSADITHYMGNKE